MEEQPRTRRGFLDLMIAVGTAITGLALALPGMAYLWPAARGGGSDRVEVDRAKDMAPGDSTTIQVGPKAVIVVRARDGFRAYSAICTHLGCLVKWDKASSSFHCPCHAAAFDRDGKVLSGPPPAPLEAYRVSEVAGKVFVSQA